MLELPLEQELADVYSEGYYRGRDEVGYRDYGKRDRKLEILRALRRMPGRFLRVAVNPLRLVRALSRDRAAIWPASGVDLINELAGNGHLLDVGCATGDFLLEARKSGWDVTGVDFSSYSSQVAREKHGLNVFTGSISSALSEGGLALESFDVVTLWDTVEHLADPLSVLTNVSRVLKDDGFVVIQTLNIDGNRAKREGQSWHFFRPPKHLFYYGEATLKHYLDKAGFDLAKDDDFSKDCVLVAGRKRSR